MTLQEQIDRMAEALRMPSPANTDPSQVFERVQGLRAHHDRVLLENEKLRARLDAVRSLIDGNRLGEDRLIPATELRAALDT